MRFISIVSVPLLHLGPLLHLYTGDAHYSAYRGISIYSTSTVTTPV